MNNFHYFGLFLDSVVCANDIPHITIATFSGGNPVDSNEIIDWRSIKPITITAKLKKNNKSRIIL